MTHLEGCEQTIIYLQGKVLELEKELERKDETHVYELKMLRDKLTTIIRLYKLD